MKHEFIKHTIYTLLGITPSFTIDNANLALFALLAFVILLVIPTRNQILESGKPPRPLQAVGFGPSFTCRTIAGLCGLTRSAAAIAQLLFMALALWTAFAFVVALIR